MQKITSGRLALVTSSLALAVAIGGTSYAAATIGAADLKANSVSSPKIKNDTVLGKDVKESSLKQVPSAASATKAGAVDGMSFAKVVYRSTSTTPTVVFNGGGLVLRAHCTGSNDLTLNATTSKQNSSIYSHLIDLENNGVIRAEDLESGNFDTPITYDMLGGSTVTEEDPAIVTFVYDAVDGTVITGTLSTDTDDCAVTGTVTFG